MTRNTIGSSRRGDFALVAGLLALAGCGGGGSGNAGSESTSPPTAFAMCAACHTVEEGGRQLAGPNLHGIVGRKAGSATGFNYSKAMTESDIIWSAETLDQFLATPSKLVPGTRMTTSVGDAERRKAIVAYLADD